METYTSFMKKYSRLHDVCPKCFGTNFSTTLAGYTLDLEHPELYKNLNYTLCLNCGWEGTVHDRIPAYWLTRGALRDKTIKEAERQESRLREQREQDIRDKIKKYLKFTKKYVRKGRSNQDHSCHAFFDIILDKDSVNKAMNTMYDVESFNKIERCNKARGRSHAISAYASYVQNLERHAYVCKYVLTAINEAYRKFVNELLDSEYELEVADEYWNVRTYKCKSWPISWFNEVFISDEKFKTSAETFIEELEEKYKKWPELPKDMPEPTDREKAWIDRYIDFSTTEEFIMHCHEIMENPATYTGLKNYKEYIDEAQKILGRRL